MVKAVSVSQLNGYIKRILASDPILMNISVMGEIANLTRHSSGHWYFSLKDENSTVRCFLAKDRVHQLRFELDEGMKVTVWGSVSVYERGGSYSVNIKDIEPLGEGELKKAFDLLVKKLSAEGLFDEERKKPLPLFPKKIGVVTSPTGAAIRDIITTVKRRNPLTDILLYPALVQGPGSAESIIQGINYFNINTTDIELLIVGRGGGSAEDLWSFNEESLARAVASSDIPVISAVGHEIDFVITDYVADLRAATPTAAAELAVPDIANYTDIINKCRPDRLLDIIKDNIDENERHIKHLHDMCNTSIDFILGEAIHRLALLKIDIESLNPMSQLEKGYAVVKTINDDWVSDAAQLAIGDSFKLIMKNGSLDCLVKGKSENEKY